MRRTLTREAFIPSGALVVRDKSSTAVCYVYADKYGGPCAMGFAGRRQKPDFRVRYMSQERREAGVRQYFASARVIQARRTKEQTKPRKLQVGHILSASWGYDQTNVDWYQVTALIGSTMVELRKISGNMTEATGWMQGKTMPRADFFTGPAFRRVAKGDSVRIDAVRWASLWDGRPESWSSYA